MKTVVLLAGSLAVAAALTLRAPVSAQGDAMTVEQVMRMPKIDAHAHLGALGAEEAKAFVAFLEQRNLRWLTIATGAMDAARLSRQIESAQALHRAHPGRIALGDVVLRRELGSIGLGEVLPRDDR